MELLFTIGSVIVLLLFLIRSADLVEDALIQISKYLRINTFTLGFVLLASTSSLPETFVTINSAIDQTQNLALGTLLGGTIILLTFVTGLAAIKFKGISFNGSYGPGEVVHSLSVIFSTVLVLIDKQLTQIEGVFLLSLYVIYVLYLIKKNSEDSASIKRKKINRVEVISKIVIGFAGLIITANLTVAQGIHLATLLNIPTLLIGLLIFSLGTNLPEIMIMLRSNDAERMKLSAGNFIGSATFNCAILGLLAITSPYKIGSFETLIPAIIILSITVFIFAELAISGKEITRKEGFILLSLFLVYVTIELSRFVS